VGLSIYNGFGPKIREESFDWLKAEIAAGRVPPPSRCQACGETEGHLDYHTEDYFRCHMMLHSRFRFPARWHRYIEQLEAGAWWKPLLSRREIGKLNLSGWVEQPEGYRGEREPMTFFRSLTMERRKDQTTLFPV
jgi:hypothetical protein